VRIKVATGKPADRSRGFGKDADWMVRERSPKKLVATASLEPSEIQDLADAMPKLLDIKAKSQLPIAFTVRVELGDGQESPPSGAAGQVNEILKGIKDGFEVGK
jgi:hypothetical protein